MREGCILNVYIHIDKYIYTHTQTYSIYIYTPSRNGTWQWKIPSADLRKSRFSTKKGHLPWIDPTGDKGILAAEHVLSSMTNGYQWQCQEMVPEIAIDSID